MKHLSVLLILFMLVASTACSGGSDDDAAADANAAVNAAAAQLFAAKCTICHPGDRGADKRLDKQGWTAVVERMQKHASGVISDEDAAKIIGHLVRIRGPE